MDEKEWILENIYLKLQIRAGDRCIEAEFQDKESGRVLAQGPYLYKLEREVEEGQLITDSLLFQKGEISHTKKGVEVLQITGRVGDLEVIHQFSLIPEKPFLDESFTLYNRGKLSIRIANLRFGFTRLITDAIGVIVSELKEDRFVAVPYRRDTLGRNGEYQDYSISDILFKRGWYRNISQKDNQLPVPVESLGAEGWAWTFKNRSLLILNYSQEHMEFSLIETDKRNDGVRLCFGGCGRWHQNPDCLGEILPGEKILCGQNHYQLLDGGFKEGYYAFRRLMGEHGHSVPEGFNPPVHWNELYDNRLWYLILRRVDTPETRKTYYCLEDMEEEAAKAKELGCESLYLDPGWDTNFASAIWGEERLGTAESFVHLMKEKYNLDVSLHCPLAVWCDPSTYSRQADRMDANGKRLKGKLCGGAKQYLDEKAKRLLKLCQAGVAFLMFDGSAYTGPCFDKTHGHPVPYTREVHCRAYLELTRRVHRKFPQVLIEMHDMLGGAVLRYCPTYYLHGLSHSFDENWGFEYMWDPMEDLLSGRAISLYYYNLAYSLPLYLHIDLRMDNMHCLEFWWYASTCRHLGVGGKHSDPAVWQAHKAAMQRYLKLKEFYTQGIFYGFGEDIHVHVLPKKQALVINLFNLTDQEVLRQESFSFEDIGISPDVPLIVEDARWYGKDSSFKVSRRMPPHSAAVIEIWSAKPER